DLKIQKSSVQIYNIKGQLVRSLSHKEDSLEHLLFWDGRDNNSRKVSSGIYLMKIEIESQGMKKEYFRNCIFLK
ncbi:MAG TPA: T9SS type A sorting domain-containing protein, partial [Candidatus Cloacimonetes bacterium]|nr:T9SS type A sorting domain-containing protein [Candidatus Cloacimonadota bacterium]